VRTGIFGGTFDPPHIGHLIVAQDAALALELDLVLFVPAADPPHKRGVPVTAAALRLRMLELAVAGDPRFRIEPLELDRPGPSWTVDTLRALAAREPDTRWSLLLGMDQFVDFASWREADVIRSLAGLAVLGRGGAGAAAGGGRDLVRPLGPGAVEVAVPRIDISSTMIRERVAAGRPIRYLVPGAVERFIFENGLYAGPAPDGRGTIGHHSIR
jgi:nicotinate-nucleotide adenylyltransferase